MHDHPRSPGVEARGPTSQVLRSARAPQRTRPLRIEDLVAPHARIVHTVIIGPRHEPRSGPEPVEHHRRSGLRDRGRVRRARRALDPVHGLVERELPGCGGREDVVDVLNASDRSPATEQDRRIRERRVGGRMVQPRAGLRVGERVLLPLEGCARQRQHPHTGIKERAATPTIEHQSVVPGEHHARPEATARFVVACRSKLYPVGYAAQPELPEIVERLDPGILAAEQQHSISQRVVHRGEALARQRTSVRRG